MTKVLPPGGSDFLSWELCDAVEADANWLPTYDPVTQDFTYRGTLPLGVYDVWVRYSDGPVINFSFPERTPVEGIYVSNTVRLTVVADGTPDVPQPAALIREDGPRMSTNHIIPHRGVQLVWAHALSGSGVTTTAVESKRQLLLKRGRREVSLPVNATVVKGGSPVPAIATGNAAGKPLFLVPLRYVAAKLGLKVRTGSTGKTFTLSPA